MVHRSAFDVRCTEIESRRYRGAGGLASCAVAMRGIRRTHPGLVQFGLAMVMGIVGLILAAGSSLLDTHLHRGLETGSEQPYVVHATGRALATNIDLTAFPPTEFERIAATLQLAGFRYVRQPLKWSSVEVRQGEFDWGITDAIIGALDAHRVEPILVLSGSPEWARGVAHQNATDAAPADPSDFARFTGEVVRRYGDRVRFIQIWDLPNYADNWDGTSATPSGYLSLLAPAFTASQEANSDVKVVLAELVPGEVDAAVSGDLAFLRGLYELGGNSYFDIVAIRLDGGDKAPTARGVTADQLSLARASLFRDVLVAYDDAATPIWVTHFGWNASPETGQVSRDQQADFVELGLRRSAQEWPWVGLLFQWAFVPSASGNDSGYALLNEAGEATPLYSRVSDLASAGGAAVAASGFAPMDSASVSYAGTWSDQHLGDQSFRTTGEVGATATLRFRGSGVVAFLRYGPESGLVHITIDGRPLAGRQVVEGASELDMASFQTVDVPVTLTRGLDQGEHELQISLASRGQLTLGGLVVIRDLSLMWPVVLLASAGAVLIALAVREVIYAIAVQGGHLQGGRGSDLWPELPRLPEWRPSRRA